MTRPVKIALLVGLAACCLLAAKPFPRVDVPDGSAAAPAITFTADTDTGLYRAAANTVAISTGGSQRATINDSGLSLAAPLASTSGGTGQSAWTTGDLLYSSNGSTLSKLAIGSANQVLTVSSGVPAWTSVSAGSVNAQTFTENGTWTKPPGCTVVRVRLIGGGGGGGSGRRGGTSTTRMGGAGGGPSNVVEITVPAALCGATEAVTIGQGGAGAPAQTVNTANGLTGSTGTQTSFGTLVRSGYGTGGQGGLSSGTSAGGYNSFVSVTESASAGQSYTGATASSLPNAAPEGNAMCPLGGGAGGGINTANGNVSGSNGGGFNVQNVHAVGTVLNPGIGSNVSGGAGGNGNTLWGVYGTGGGGGGPNGGTGGNGANYGSGGGGGGGSTNGTNSGAGGNGAPGYALIISF